MEVQHSICHCCNESTMTDKPCTLLPTFSEKGHPETNNYCCTATHNNYTTTTPINETQKCILSYFSSFYFSGELTNRYWHHRWRRRSFSFLCRRCEKLMEEESPLVPLCLSTRSLKNPSSPKDLVKLSFLMVTTLVILVMAPTLLLISNWFFFGACLKLSFILLSLVPTLLGLFNQLLCNKPMLVIGMLFSNTKSLWNIYIMFIKKLIKCVINPSYSIVKKKVVVEPVSCGFVTTTNRSKKCRKDSRTSSKSTTSMVVLLLYTAFLGISQTTTGRKT